MNDSISLKRNVTNCLGQLLPFTRCRLIRNIFIRKSVCILKAIVRTCTEFSLFSSLCLIQLFTAQYSIDQEINNARARSVGGRATNWNAFQEMTILPVSFSSLFICYVREEK